MGVKWEASGVYLALGGTDTRKQTSSLAAIVQGQLGLDAFGGQLFVFCNRRATKRAPMPRPQRKQNSITPNA